MAVLRFCMLLSLVVWVGGIIFFAVVAASVFAVLPTHHLAGSVVNRVLPILHWMGIASGLVFAVTSMSYSYLATGAAQPWAARHVIIYLMIALTLISQLGLVAKMATLRTGMGNIDEVSPNDPRRREFNRLHEWSTRIEQTVLVLGLAVIYLTARRLS
jgi:hypothetical protein